MKKAEKLDAHSQPPDYIKNQYKIYQKVPPSAIDQDTEILDFSQGIGSLSQNHVREGRKLARNSLLSACCELQTARNICTMNDVQDVQVYEATRIPGLSIIPSLLPKEIQRDLLSQLLHRELANKWNKTNVHLHHWLPYSSINRAVPILSDTESDICRESFFNISPNSDVRILPINEALHKPFSISQFLNRRLRWITLGGQYDWTRKCYPLENPGFPSDIAGFTHHLFPEMRAEAAIVNIYTPGDTLSIHRDVSEDSDKGLVSISLGCDGLFVIGTSTEEKQNPEVLTVRLRTGDAVFMDAAARFAWHGIPQVLPNTCPDWLRDWPANGEDQNSIYETWRGWMSNKRINLNMRQMKA